MARQATRADRRARADFVIENDDGRDELMARVDACWTWIEGLLAAEPAS